MSLDALTIGTHGTRMVSAMIAACMASASTSFDCRSLATTARLSVRDTGPGIPADELPRIWDRLFRGDTSRTERGLGLGLSLVKAIVEAHGGAASVDSQPGRGSTFTVSLPASEARAGQAGQAGEAGQAG